jgi:heme oxygenase (biliverdin-producing, ferredoxin)
MAAGSGIANYHAPSPFDRSPCLDTATRPFNLAQRLRESTHELHAEVERAGAMGALLQGRLARGGYVALLRNLHAVYAALEAALAERAGAPLLAPLDLPALARADALALDLAHLHGAGWAAALPLAPAAAAYARRLQAAPATALVAHAYVRYLGDLAGGQVLARLVQRSYGLAPGSGARFYDFGGEAHALALKRDFRAALAVLPVTAAEADAVVDEACWAFRQHRALFEELA